MKILQKKEKKFLNIKLENNFLVDILKNDNEYIEFWLYNEDYGIKEFMFGIPNTKECSEEYLLNLLINNLDNYINLYIKEYMEVK